MKIKVFILFSFLFLGIGFEGVGQYYSYDDFVKVELETDTTDIAFYKKLKILRSCEGLVVHENGKRIVHWYRKEVIIPDSLYDGELGWSPVKDMLLFSSKNDGIVDIIVQPMTKEYPVMEKTRACVWTLNKEGKYKIDKFFEWGNVIKVSRDKNQILLIEVESHGCCDHYFICNDIYAYENDSLILREQMCYLRMQKEFREVSKLKRNGFITTSDSTYLRGYNSMYYNDYQYMVDYSTEKDSVMKYYYDEDILAVIEPNQKGEVLDKKFEDKMYWYLVVFPPKAIRRRIFDYMIGEPDKRLSLAGWIKSETPLKIESK